MLIVFEGIDGVGKSTQASLLHQFLTKQDRPVILTGPFETKYGKAVRELFITSQVSRKTELSLIASAISNVLEEVTPLLNDHLVIFDRFTFSTYAYHGAGFGVGDDVIRNIFKATLPPVEPTIVFLLDLDEDLAFERSGKTKDRIEQLPSGFRQTVRSAYLRMARDDHRFVVLDASKPPEEVHKEILAIVRQHQLR